eukprot:scaffold308727_cov36-Tisochrysis_lutea.AAC.6
MCERGAGRCVRAEPRTASAARGLTSRRASSHVSPGFRSSERGVEACSPPFWRTNRPRRAVAPGACCLCLAVMARWVRSESVHSCCTCCN